MLWRISHFPDPEEVKAMEGEMLLREVLCLFFTISILASLLDGTKANLGQYYEIENI